MGTSEEKVFQEEKQSRVEALCPKTAVAFLFEGLHRDQSGRKGPSQRGGICWGGGRGDNIM